MTALTDRLAAIGVECPEVEAWEHIHGDFDVEAYRERWVKPALSALVTIIEEQAAENERLQCCGNCFMSDWDGQQGGIWCASEQIRLHRPRGDSEMDVRPFDHCHFTPSRWQPQEEAP